MPAEAHDRHVGDADTTVLVEHIKGVLAVDETHSATPEQILSALTGSAGKVDQRRREKRGKLLESLRSGESSPA